jgi:hypothetical protein
VLPLPAPAAVTPAAARFVAAHADALPVTDVERVCLSEQVAADPALMEEATVAPVQQVLAWAITVCKHKVSFAEAFVVGMAQSHPGLGLDQQICLRHGYGALSPEDLEAVMATGVRPASPAAERGRGVLAELVGRCGL